MKKVIRSYADHRLHREIGRIIQARSENRKSVREAVEAMIDAGRTETILDLGCGYGWFEEGLKGHFRHIYGIDSNPENEEEFLRASQDKADKASFESLLLPAAIAMPSGYFDLVVAAYSLYFFPDQIGEIRRLMAEDGTLLALTHSESMLEEGEKYFEFTNMRKVIRRFSAENGEATLRASFGRVSYVDYQNSLVFDRTQQEDLIKYIDFKREFIAKDVDPAAVKERMLTELRTKGEVRLNKNDRIFAAKK